MCVREGRLGAEAVARWRAARQRFRAMVQGSEPCRHLAAAGREGLLALRAVLDAAVRHLDMLSRPPESRGGEASPHQP
jgi:hypothetical protein